MRIFTAFWWIFSLLLSQTYIAKLAAFITASKMESSVSSLHDLVNQNKIQFGMLKGGSTSFLFSESNESEYRVAWNKMVSMKPDAFTSSNKEGVNRVKLSRGHYAYLLETTALQYYLNRNCELKQIGEPFNEKHYAIAVPLSKWKMKANLLYIESVIFDTQLFRYFVLSLALSLTLILSVVLFRRCTFSL